MKLTTGILLTTMMMAGAAWGQNPNIIQSTQDKVNAAEQQKVAKENEALSTPQSQSQTSAKPGSKPSPAGAKATSKPAVPAPKPAGTATAKPATPAAKPASASAKPLISVKPAAPAKPAVTAAKPARSADKKDNTAAQAAPNKPAPTKIAVSPVSPQPKQGAQKTGSAARKSAAKPATP